ncbi:hypothetical protein BJ741DRAFT_662729 [Chytriomyces cf. hyalinus JEL632]|nr:hypothetical protein BJ741DRAFT_662729 [Chytriomyces cf. hyalinus JEL632]
MDTLCPSWKTAFATVTNPISTVCVPHGTTLAECTTMTDGTNSLWYANKTLSATHSNQYGINSFFSYTANMPRSPVVTFEVMPFGIGFYYSLTDPGLVYNKGPLLSNLCLRSTFPFLALVINDVISWNETTDPPFYQTPQQPSPPSTSVSVSSNGYNGTRTWIYLLTSAIIVLMIYSWRRQWTSRSTSSPVTQPVIRQRPGAEALPVLYPRGAEALPVCYQSHELDSVVSAAPLVARPPHSSTGLSVASGRVSVAASASGSEALLLESWSVEEVAAWVRLNNAGSAGADKVRENQMDGRVLAQLTVEEILQVLSLDDDFEKDKLREALAVLKANNGETPPVYV